MANYSAAEAINELKKTEDWMYSKLSSFDDECYEETLETIKKLIDSVKNFESDINRINNLLNENLQLFKTAINEKEANKRKDYNSQIEKYRVF